MGLQGSPCGAPMPEEELSEEVGPWFPLAYFPARPRAGPENKSRTAGGWQEKKK